ncbi:MAG: hypothetical protein QW103_02565 [Candidatus Pacearchaeota archaeon]
MEKQLWRLSILDGNDEDAVFDCLPEGNTSFEKIKERRFSYAYWKCYNGEEMKKGSEEECLPSEIWKAYANKFCWDKCKKENKCGVDSFAVFDECYYDETNNDFNESIKEYLQESATKKEVLVCKDACPLEGKCYQFGHRKNSMFCSDEGFFVKQLKAGEKCENNWECFSNVCVSGKCVSEGLVQKIINWFKKLFGE